MSRAPAACGRLGAGGEAAAALQDGGLPIVSVNDGAVRRFSWTSIHLTGECAQYPVRSPDRRSDAAAGDDASVAAKSVSVVTGGVPAQPTTPPSPLPLPPPVGQQFPPLQVLTVELNEKENLSILGVALLANCHVSLVIFGAVFLAVGTLLCVIAFRMPSSVTNDYQTRVAGTFFLCLAFFMCTSGLFLCRMDQQLNRSGQELSGDTECPIHSEKRACRRVLPSFQRVRQSTRRTKRSVLNQMDECWVCHGSRKHADETKFSSINLLAGSNDSISCDRPVCASYGAVKENTEVASFPTACARN